MNDENNNNSQEILKLLDDEKIPYGYTGIVEWANGDKEWYLNGELHRTDGPAVENVNGDKEWWINGRRHRTDGPAREWSDESKEWYLNGKKHRTDGPVIEWPSGYKAWYLNGERHRTNGPAIEFANGDKWWYLNGIEVNPLFLKIPNCEKYVDYYLTILQTELVEHEEFLLKELKKQVESGIKLNETNQK